MATVYEDGFFHLRGRHVQHAHGRNSTKGGEHLTGAMIALMPAESDAKRLRISGGEKTDNLHLTLFFLGEGDEWEEHYRESLINSVIDRVSESKPSPVKSRVFGVNHWNGDGDNPCWVLSVGDPREMEDDYSSLESIREIVAAALEDLHKDADIPKQFSPWIPHICMAYTDDLSLAKELQKRLGEVEFDRIRIIFGGEYTDIALGSDSLTAAAPPLRRNATDLEIKSKADFARMQSEWESLVDETLEDIQGIRQQQTDQIVDQVNSAAQLDDLDALNQITVSDEDLYLTLLGHMVLAANEAGQQQQREAEEQGVEVPEWSLDNLTAAVGIDLLRSIARVTSRVISTSFVQSAVRKALSLIGRPSVSPEQVSEEVREHLEGLSEASVKESIGGAITSAQNEGRRTVLSVAPPATEYVASEILDRNVCGPCRQVDGTSFETLADASEQYPSGGFKDCLGGVRCRGTVVAIWEDPFGEE